MGKGQRSMTASIAGTVDRDGGRRDVLTNSMGVGVDLMDLIAVAQFTQLNRTDITKDQLAEMVHIHITQRTRTNFYDSCSFRRFFCFGFSLPSVLIVLCICEYATHRRSLRVYSCSRRCRPWGGTHPTVLLLARSTSQADGVPQKTGKDNDQQGTLLVQRFHQYRRRHLWRCLPIFSSSSGSSNRWTLCGLRCGSKSMLRCCSRGVFDIIERTRRPTPCSYTRKGG